MIKEESRSTSKDKLHFSVNSNMPFNEDSRSRPVFLNNTYLHNFLDFTNQFKETNVTKQESNHNARKQSSESKYDIGLKVEDSKKCKEVLCQIIYKLIEAKIMPMMFKSETEPRYVNAAQYHRMMIMRIKRAQKVLKYQQEMQKYKEQQLGQDDSKKKYKYESRHLHAKNRQRGPDGKFVKKEDQVKSQELEDLQSDLKSKKLKKAA